ncbi:MAG: hypothetical protein OXL68_10670 [Paracoccaceae bacterium]|nr:hypothetical protein [Paracoccaceae bacterium]
MREGIPVAIYLQVLSLLIGLVAVAIPVAIALVGVFVSRRFSSRLDSIAADLDEALGRIDDLEKKGSTVIWKGVCRGLSQSLGHEGVKTC